MLVRCTHVPVSMLPLSIRLHVGPSSLVKIHSAGATEAGVGPGGGPGFLENNASGETAWLVAQVPTHTSCVTDLHGPEVYGKLVEIQITPLNVDRLALCLFVASMWICDSYICQIGFDCNGAGKLILSDKTKLSFLLILLIFFFPLIRYSFIGQINCSCV